MMIGQPMTWATLLYITGILAGYAFPSPIYLLLLGVTLVCASILYRKEHAHDILLMSFWLFFGAARIHTSTTYTDGTTATNLLHTVQDKAQETNTYLQSRLEESGLSGEELAVSSALLLGNKAHLGKSTRKRFASVGASHLLALSGMHLGIIYGILYLLFIRRVIRTQWRWNALPLILLCIWGYVWLTGMPVSLIRAALMLSLLTIGLMLRIRFPHFHLLAMSALIILLFSPMELFSVSFQMSFTAVFFILALYSPLGSGIWNIKSDRLVKAIRFILLCIVAQLGTMPLSLYYFHTLPLLGIPASMILIPLTSIILYTGIACLLLPIPLIGGIHSFLVRCELAFVDKCSALPHATIDNLHPEAWQIAIVYLILVILTRRTASFLQSEY